MQLIHLIIIVQGPRKRRRDPQELWIFIDRGGGPRVARAPLRIGDLKTNIFEN